jgi:RNA polymerase sigma-70 factor, ECF subfamily
MRHSEIMQLVGDARAGSKTALGTLLQRYRPLLLELARVNLPPELAGKLNPSDLVQITFADAVSSIEQLRAQSEAEVRAWLCVLLTCNVEDAARQFIAGKREVRRERSLDASHLKAHQVTMRQGLPTPAHGAATQEDLDRVQQAIARLSGGHRKLIEWRNREGLSYVEIAKRLEISPDAARMRWKRAIKHLAKALADGKPRDSDRHPRS